MIVAGKFEKVSLDAFRHYVLVPTEEELLDIYNSITLPKRATTGSAGYDFVAPYEINLNPGQCIVIPTGIRCKIREGWMLGIYPRSGLGFKTHVRLANTVGIIDSDYYHADNEGHIMVKLVTDSEHPLHVTKGDRFCQGIFTQFGVVEDDYAVAERTGGMGSTD